MVCAGKPGGGGGCGLGKWAGPQRCAKPGGGWGVGFVSRGPVCVGDHIEVHDGSESHWGGCEGGVDRAAGGRGVVAGGAGGGVPAVEGGVAVGGLGLGLARCCLGTALGL